MTLTYLAPIGWLGRVRPLVALLVLAAACAPGSHHAFAQSPKPEQAEEQPSGEAVIAPDERLHRVTFRQLGAIFPLQLRGVEGTSGVQFGVRSDEVVTSARLHLNYAYSPALLPDISHLRVMVNEQVVATVPVPKEEAGQRLQRTIDIPAQVIGEFNRLNLQLIGHYTLECEDPTHSSLWANVDNDSVLELSVTPLQLPDNLAFLPGPFFDRRDARPLNLPIVFTSTPDAGQLEAAGTLSSWFGALASFRGASFPTSIGELPTEGHAVVLALGGNPLPGVELPVASGPSISMVAHPSDSNAKLLVISGRDTQELKRAAAALSVGASALSGPSASITDFKQITPRKPYDAPNWLASDRPVKFGELQDAAGLNVSGYSPDLIRVNFQVPPDLFSWRNPGIPVHLKYRYTARPDADKSTLNINSNEQFLRSLALRTTQHAAPSVLERVIEKVTPGVELLPAQDFFHVPLFKLPARSQLQFHYYYEIKKEGFCRDVPLDNVRGTVEPDSTIDISKFPHFLAMPDLAAFGNSGFPFSRMADLSETAVILPERPQLEDYATYLALMGLIGNATGYPGHAVTVALGVDQLSALKDKDLLVVASGANAPLMQQWASHLPFSLNAQAKGFRLSDYASHLLNWWDPDLRDRAKPGRNEIVFNSTSDDAVLAGFESPLKGGRSVVLLASNKPAGLRQAVHALLTPDLLKQIQGSAAVIRDKQVDSLVAEQSYYIGSLGFFTYVQWWFSRHPLALVLFGLMAAALIGLMLYGVLRARSRMRLKTGGQA